MKNINNITFLDIKKIFIKNNIKYESAITNNELFLSLNSILKAPKDVAIITQIGNKIKREI